MRDVFPLPDQLLEALERVCRRKAVYRNSRLRPQPLLIWVEEGEGCAPACCRESPGNMPRRG